VIRVDDDVSGNEVTVVTTTEVVVEIAVELLVIMEVEVAWNTF
jgi:hypothetical protein